MRRKKHFFHSMAKKLRMHADGKGAEMRNKKKILTAKFGRCKSKRLQNEKSIEKSNEKTEFDDLEAENLKRENLKTDEFEDTMKHKNEKIETIVEEASALK